MEPPPSDDRMTDDETSEQAFDPARRLCPDGDCVGVLGSDDRCKVCGARGGDAAPGLGPEAFGGGCFDEPSEDAPQAAEADLSSAGFDPTRRLCADGACIGVIGADGRCLECGRTAPSAEGA